MVCVEVVPAERGRRLRPDAACGVSRSPPRRGWRHEHDHLPAAEEPACCALPRLTPVAAASAVSGQLRVRGFLTVGWECAAPWRAGSLSAASSRLCARAPGVAIARCAAQSASRAPGSPSALLRSLSRRMLRAWGRAARLRHWVEHRLPHRRDNGLWLVLVMGRAGAIADGDPLLIGQLLGDHRVLVFDNRGRATTSTPSPEAGDGAADGAGPARAGRCAAITTFDLMGGEIAQQVAAHAPDRVFKLVLCATGPGSANAHAPGHHDGVDGGHRRRDRGAGGADAVVSGARDRRDAHRRAAGPAIALRRPRLPRTAGAVGRGGQDREKAVGWGAAATAILVPLIIPLFSLSLGQDMAAMARSTRRTSLRRRAS